MSTSAPTAGQGPGPSSDAGEEAIVRAPDTGDQHLPDPAKVRKGKAASPIKPIPPAKAKVQLPGVDTGPNPASPFDQKIAKALGKDIGHDDSGLSDGDVQPAQVREGKETTPAPKAAPQRGPDGKFVSAAGEPEAAPAGDEGAEGQEGAEGPVETPPPPEGSDLPQTLEEAHEALKKTTQQYKSLQGMFGPLNAANKELAHHQREAAISATSWQKDSQAKDAVIADLRSKLQQYEGGTAPSRSPVPTGGDQGRVSYDLASVVKAIPWDKYGAYHAQGPDVAAAWLVSQILPLAERNVRADLEALRGEFDAFRRPIEEANQDHSARTAVVNNVMGAFDAVAEIRDAEGNPVFPELWDDKEAEAVGNLWMKSSLPKEYLQSPMGIVQSILNYRFFKGANPAAVPAATPPAGSREEPLDNSDRNARGVRAVIAGRGAAPMPSNGGQPSSPADIIKSNLRSTRLVDDDIGFPRRQR